MVWRPHCALGRAVQPQQSLLVTAPRLPHLQNAEGLLDSGPAWHCLGQRLVGTLPWQFELRGPVVGWGMGMPIIPLKEREKRNNEKQNYGCILHLYSQHRSTDPH